MNPKNIEASFLQIIGAAHVTYVRKQIQKRTCKLTEDREEMKAWLDPHIPINPQCLPIPTKNVV